MSVIKGPYLSNIFWLRFSYAVLNSVFKLITSATFKRVPSFDKEHSAVLVLFSYWASVSRIAS